MPLFSLPYYEFYIIFEITENEAKTNAQLEYYIELESGILNTKNLKYTKYTFKKNPYKSIYYFPTNDPDINKNQVKSLLFNSCEVELSYPVTYKVSNNVTFRDNVIRIGYYESVECDELNEPVKITYKSIIAPNGVITDRNNLIANV